MFSLNIRSFVLHRSITFRSVPSEQRFVPADDFHFAPFRSIAFRSTLGCGFGQSRRHSVNSKAHAEPCFMPSLAPAVPLHSIPRYYIPLHSSRQPPLHLSASTPLHFIPLSIFTRHAI